MNYIIFLFLGFMPPTPFVEKVEKPILIAVDDEFNSVMIRNELTRNWIKYVDGTPEELQERAELGTKYNEIQSSIKVIFYTPVEANKHNGLPAYKFDRYDEWTSFDPRTFKITTYPLLTVKSIYDYYNWDFIEQRFKERNQRVYDLNTKLNELQYEKMMDKLGIKNNREKPDQYPKGFTINGENFYIYKTWREYVPTLIPPKKPELPYLNQEELNLLIEKEENEDEGES